MMENWGLSSAPNGVFVDLDSPIQTHHQQVHEPHNYHHNHHMHVSMNMMTGIENYEQMGNRGGPNITNLSSGKLGCSSNIKNDIMSDDEDDENCAGMKGGKKGGSSSPWQRMKWTDNVVRLLIAVVASVGEDGTPEGVEGTMKRKSAVLQKKGKWKTASKIMISKGCYVSPQQCEDKFNDLNKRYKKLNDILGRVNSFRVLEDPSIMDSMPQLSAKLKEEVKKILSSKHLFYKEMCAYHSGQRIPNCEDIDLHVHPSVSIKCSKDSNGSDGEEAQDDSESEDDHNSDDDGNDMNTGKERPEEFAQKQSNAGERNLSFEEEIDEILGDPSMSQSDKRQWIKKRLFQLEEENTGIQVEGLEIDKRIFKWCRFRSKKERELDRSRLENERAMLEHERMELQFRDKDFDLKCKTPFAPILCNNMDRMPR